MSAISSNTLLHFTESLDTLESIITKGFLPRYSLEEYRVTTRIKFNSAFPMVCFCDLPLSQIKNHSKTYGHYGLGMTKNWGVTAGLNPVLYLQANSHFAQPAASLFKQIVSTKPGDPNYETIAVPYGGLLRFLKPYRGRFVHKGVASEDFLFYDEREWRFVPELNQSDLENFLAPAEFSNAELLKKSNEQASKHPLAFDLTDIKYLFLESDSEINRVVAFLQSIGGAKYTFNDIQVLTSKILTREKVENDF